MAKLHSIQGPCEEPLEFRSHDPVERADREWTDSAASAMATLESMSRHIMDLARELNCLGFFDDDPDRPRAA
jgi:hypothetical protein